MKTLIEQLSNKVLIGDDCWDWTGAHMTTGYGSIRVKGRGLLAHRVLYELLVGPIPEGLQIDHLCRNRGCVNPKHMEPVTNRENTIRGNADWPLAKLNRLKTHCPQGHPYAGDNLYYERGSRLCRECNRAKSRRRRERCDA